MDKGNESVIRFTIPGPPQGKARARTFYNSRMGKYQSVTPEHTVMYENLVKTFFLREACGKRFEGGIPLSVTLTAYFEPPGSISKKKRGQMLEGSVRPVKKPDIDNILKTVLDALNGIAYHDDTQVTEVSAKKLYGDTSRVEVVIAHAS